CDNGHLHGTHIRCNETGIQRNRIRCLIMTPAATADTQRQLRPRGVQPLHPPRPHPADLEGQLRDVHANCRMMQLMQLRSLSASSPAHAAHSAAAWCRKMAVGTVLTTAWRARAVGAPWAATAAASLCS